MFGRKIILQVALSFLYIRASKLIFMSRNFFPPSFGILLPTFYLIFTSLRWPSHPSIPSLCFPCLQLLRNKRCFSPDIIGIVPSNENRFGQIIFFESNTPSLKSFVCAIKYLFFYASNSNTYL